MTLLFRATTTTLVPLALMTGCTRLDSTGKQASGAANIMSCVEAIKLYESKRWQSLWDIKEILCGSRDPARFPAVKSSACLTMASELAMATRDDKDIKIKFSDVETTCYGKTTEDAVKERCLKGEFNEDYWATADCTSLTGMNYGEFEKWFDKNN